MATLVLGSLGLAVGGPIGGAIGSLLGQSIDRSLFAPGPRVGPRLGDLAVQTSSYGTPVPRIYGTMRVAGTVVWATPLKETSGLVGGGKGQSGTVAYAYSVSLAVALSSRPSAQVKRIWADGKLLRGSSGEFKVRTQFRFHSGEGNQPLDPLIAAIEGPLATPAYRGMAMAVFEDLDLAPFGNRIPILTFELEADAIAPTLGGILSDGSRGAIMASDPRPISGYAAYGVSIREGLAGLIESFGVNLRDGGTRLIDGVPGPLRLIARIEMGCGEGTDSNVRRKRWQQTASALPERVSLSYYDPARDYQTGQKQATGSRTGGQLRAVALAAVMPAALARSLCEDIIARAWGQRERLALWLPVGLLDLQAGQNVLLEGDGASWLVESVTIERLVVRIELKRAHLGLNLAMAAEPGRQSAQIDVPNTPTILTLIDLPSFDSADTITGIARVVLAASRSGPGWLPVPVLFNVAGAEQSGQTATARAVLGQSLNVLGDAGSCLIDTANVLEVELLNEADWLQSCDDLALCARVNLMAVGQELIQFGDATPISSRRFRLSRLLRGRGGTEWASAGHFIGEQVVLLDPATLSEVPLAQHAVGATLLARPLGLGDHPSDAPASLLVRGEATRPPSPVHLKAIMQAGALQVDWVRRSRAGWAWVDGIDAPLSEDTERYRLSINGSAGTIERDVFEPRCAVSSAEMTSIGSTNLTISVVQVGSAGVSAISSIAL